MNRLYASLFSISLTMHILLVEDTKTIWKALHEYLSLSGFSVKRCEDIQSAHYALANNHFDCAVLDRMLPDGDGAELCQQIKTTKPLPVIMMTAKSQIDDKVQAYSYGADDYITKPFDLKELELRINAVTKRTPPESTTLHLKDITIDLEQHTIYKDWQKMLLSHTEFLILQMLVDRKWSVVSRTDLLEEIRWEESMRWSDNKLDVYIYALRKKLGKSSIRTIKGVWYQLDM